MTNSSMVGKIDFSRSAAAGPAIAARGTAAIFFPWALSVVIAAAAAARAAVARRRRASPTRVRPSPAVSAPGTRFPFIPAFVGPLD